jgi:heme exporter protein D
MAAAHTGFILAAYAVAFAVVGGLTAWVMLDYRAQRRTLASLEQRGVTRRSATATPAEPATRQAREEA